jgi:hypothetical protein
MIMRLGLSILVTVALSTGARADEKADAPKPTAPGERNDMKQLFTKDLEGWDGDPGLWSFKDGIVRGQTTKDNPARGNTFLIWKGGTLEDFELRLSFKIDPAPANSGVQYRSKHLPFKESDSNKWVVSGYQAEVEDTPGKAGFLYHERGRGELCHVGEKVEIGGDGKPKVVGKLGDKAAIGATYKKGDWNDYVIIAKGNHIVQYLNGIQTIDVVDNDPKGGALSGILALQIHAGKPMLVQFKNVRLKQFERAEKK